MTVVLVFVIVYLSLVTAFVIWREKRRPTFVVPAGATMILPGICPKCGYDMSVKFERTVLGGKIVMPMPAQGPTT